MTKLEIPANHAKKIRAKAQGDGVYVVAFDDESEGQENYTLLINSPAMAEEIKRLREENSNLLGSLKFYQQLSDERNGLLLMRKNQLLALEAEIEALRRSPATREDRAFQCLQGLLANEHTWEELHEKDFSAFAIRHTDAMLAALAKPQGAQETEKLELPPGCTPFDIKEVRAKMDALDAIPAGCEPFDIERAKVEGARTSSGAVKRFVKQDFDTDGTLCFKFSETEDGGYWYESTGYIRGQKSDVGRLYCIAKPVTRLFDLEKPLYKEGGV